MTGNVMVRVAEGRYRFYPLADVLAQGGVKVETKTCPTGRKEAVYEIPGSRVKRQRTPAEMRRDKLRGLGGGRSTLTAAERKSLETQLGVPIHDAQDARRVMRERGVRFMEKGEAVDEETDALIDYAEAGGTGEPPEILRHPGAFVPLRKPEAFNHAEEFKKAEARWREAGGRYPGEE